MVVNGPLMVLASVMFLLGMTVGWAVGRRERPVRAASATESPEESLRRLSARAGGATPVQRSLNSPSGQARADGGMGVLIVPEHMVWR